MALAFMTTETGLMTTRFALLWNGQEIDSLDIGIPRPFSQAPNGTERTHVPDFNLTSSPASLASDASLSSDVVKVTTVIAHSGGDLRKHDVLMTIAGALAEAAEEPSEARVDYDWSS